MIQYWSFFVALFILLAFGQVLALIFKQHAYWKYTDYLWYGLAAASLLIFVADANETAKSYRLSELNMQLERAFDRALKDYVAEARLQPSDLKFDEFLYRQLLDFRESSRFPSGEYVELNGTRHENVFAYLRTFQRPGALTDMPEVLNLFFDSVEMGQAQRAIDELNSPKNKPEFVDAALLQIAAYLLAFGVSIRLGKVTAFI
ncbi:MAG: hypothetical protein AAFQ69_18790 [Pseudomonadota bacterium]